MSGFNIFDLIVGFILFLIVLFFDDFNISAEFLVIVLMLLKLDVKANAIYHQARDNDSLLNRNIPKEKRTADE